MQSPHLPPKSSSLKQRNALMTLPWLLLFCALAAVIAAVVSTSFLAWYVPDYVRYQVPVSITAQQHTGVVDVIDPLLARQIEERQVRLFTGTADQVVFTEDQYVTDAIVLSSDGWIAFIGGANSTLVALDADGGIYPVGQTMRDPLTNISYAKLEEGNFLVTPIASWANDTHKHASTWVYTPTGWSEQPLSHTMTLQTDTSVSLYEPYSAFVVDTAVDGTIVYSSTGSFLGFVDQGILVPGWHVTYALPYVLGEQTVPTMFPALTANVVRTYRDPLSQTFVDSMAVQVVQIPTTVSTTLAVGDIVTMVNNQPVSIQSLAKQLWLGESFSMQVLREGTLYTVRYSDAAVVY